MEEILHQLGTIGNYETANNWIRMGETIYQLVQDFLHQRNL